MVKNMIDTYLQTLKEDSSHEKLKDKIHYSDNADYPEDIRKWLWVSYIFKTFVPYY